MSYATSQQFIDRIGEPETIQLTNLDDPAATTVNTVPLEAALADASAVIDGYCGGRYQLPLVPLPVIVTRYCVAIARQYLDRIKTREDVRQEYEDAIAALKDISSGKMSIGATALGTAADEELIGTDVSGARSERETRIDMVGF